MVKPKNSMPAPDGQRDPGPAAPRGNPLTADHLRFSTEMLRRLVEELNPHADQGILELVRNAYDADASVCIVELINTHHAGETIRVFDNGLAMTTASIRDGLLVLGKSVKTKVKQTAIK